jgi:phosphoglycolate phosphatase
MTIDPQLRQVLDRTGPVLLDFDGPVTQLFIEGRNVVVADQMKAVLREQRVALPESIARTVDPLAVLRWSAVEAPPQLRHRVEATSITGEVIAAGTTEPTPGAHELLAACKAADRPVVIVSNNAEEAIRAYLTRYQLQPYIAAVMARTTGHPELMKPHPDIIIRALKFLGSPAGDCCMIGDSVTDIEVSLATGVHPIGYGKTPRRTEELRAAGAFAIVTTMQDLVAATRATTALMRT